MYYIFSFSSLKTMYCLNLHHFDYKMQKYSEKYSRMLIRVIFEYASIHIYIYSIYIYILLYIFYISPYIVGELGI